MGFAIFLTFLTLAAACACAQATVPPFPNFSFIQITDEHFPDEPASIKTISEIAQLGEIRLQPYGITAPAPSFIIETGDITEFGRRNGAWAAYNKAWSKVEQPRYMALGNHDETWQPLSPEITRLYGAPYYSWDLNGCHFVVLNSSGLLDPRPVFSPEELEWLTQDLARVGPDTPVFLAFHHPLDCIEFSSSYEIDRLVDLLRPYNVIAAMVGHSHSIKYTMFDGIDMVRGGSAYGAHPPAHGLAGYVVTAIVDGVVSMAFKEHGKPEAAIGLMQRPITPPAKRYPTITIESPEDRGSCKSIITVKARISMPACDIKSACFEIDGAKKTRLSMCPDGSFQGTRNIRSLTAGAHYIRVSFMGRDHIVYHRSASFYVETGAPMLQWRTFTGAASKSTPAIFKDMVCVGANDGYLRAYNCQTSELSWQFKTGGPVTGEALVLDDRICFGSEDMNLYCVNPSGELVWKYDAKSPIHSSAVTDGKCIFFGCDNGAFYSIDVAAGTLNWVNRDATYTIEAKPFVADGRIYYGAWDRFVYCLNATDGKLVWKSMAQGSAEKAAAFYYCAADCGPVVCADKLFIADRKHKLSIMDVKNGIIVKVIEDISAVGLAENGEYVYARCTDGNLTKIDSQGIVVWKQKCSMDDVPAAPREVAGIVYVCSKRGLVSALSAEDGKLSWNYQATPASYILSSVGASNCAAYISGTDGSITALKK